MDKQCFIGDDIKIVFQKKVIYFLTDIYIYIYIYRLFHQYCEHFWTTNRNLMTILTKYYLLKIIY